VARLLGAAFERVPDDPAASSLGRLFYAATAEVSRAVSTGAYGYRVGTFLPAGHQGRVYQDVEAMWLDQGHRRSLLAKGAENVLARAVVGAPQTFVRPCRADGLVSADPGRRGGAMKHCVVFGERE